MVRCVSQEVQEKQDSAQVEVKESEVAQHSSLVPVPLIKEIRRIGGQSQECFIHLS